MPNITLIPGDGIGPEIIREDKKVIESASRHSDCVVTNSI